MRTWGGAGVSVLVCTRGAALEINWWKFGGCFSVDTTIYTHFSTRLHVLIWYTRRN